MKPTKVAISCNSNPYYLEFWEPVSRVWKHKFGIEPYLFYVGSEKSLPPNEHGTVVAVPVVQGIPEHTQAQWARFHFTQSDPDAVWLTSDIDMFPLSREYFFDLTSRVSEDCFVSLNSDMRDYFPVCYNMARGSVFSEVLGLSSDFSESVKRVYENAKTISHIVNGKIMENWGCDEKYSSAMICDFRSRFPSRVVQILRPGGFHGGRRIDRNQWSYDESLVKADWYLDCHSLRPYRDNKQEIERLLGLAIQ
jgi:hypothetical protein